MPTLISGGRDWIRISDAIGKVYRGNVGDEGNKVSLRPIVGPIVTVYDIEKKGHILKGILRKREIPYTGDKQSEQMFLLGPML